MKKLLITGASGFLGRRAAAYFAKYCTVITPTHQELDITNGPVTTQEIEKHHPDVVLHCAAVSDVGACEKAPETSWDINVNGSINIARAAGLVGAKCILCSSDQVYFGSPLTEPHRETETLSPGNLYGREKLAAENMCLEVNPDSVLLRLSWMYDSHTLSDCEHGDFLRTLLPQLGTSEPLSYPIHDRRGITDVNEVIHNLEHTFTLQGGVYNFGSPNHMSTFELMGRVFTRLGLDQGRLTQNTCAFSDAPRNLCMNTEKIKGANIAFSSTEEGLVRAIQTSKIQGP